MDERLRPGRARGCHGLRAVERAVTVVARCAQAGEVGVVLAPAVGDRSGEVVAQQLLRQGRLWLLAGVPASIAELLGHDGDIPA